MILTIRTPVGHIAAAHPLATRVFARRRIDYCCGGGRALGDACADLGLDAAAVLDEVRRELEGPADAGERWNETAPRDLIEHILSMYHRPLREELARLESMARKVLEVHRDKDPRLADLLAVLAALRAELGDHMDKEEQILFPMILQGQGAFADGPILVMREEHEAAAASLRRLRSLSDDYRVPEQACNTWRALWHGLAALEDDLHRHIHLENNILFPSVQPS